MFGVFWGAASVVFLIAWGKGVARMLETNFTKVGPNLAVVWAGRIGEQYSPAADRRILWFTRADERALASRCHIAGPIGGESFVWATVSYLQRAYDEDLRGVEAVNFELRAVRLAAGRPITQSDVAQRSRVAVLGWNVRKKLLGAQGGVGSNIRIDGRPYEVVGILARVGTQLWRDRSKIDDQVWIPITTLLARGPRYGIDDQIVDNLLYRFPDRHAYAAAKAEVRHILADRLRVSPHDQEAIYVVSAYDALRQIPLNGIQAVLVLLAVTTLAIGGVGVMNMMLDAVHERRGEIGVRLAVGARRRDVVLQFFLETLTLTAAGGLTGIVGGVLGALWLRELRTPALIPIPILGLPVVAMALGVLIAVGVSAGMLPAWRAARVDPAEILRVE